MITRPSYVHVQTPNGRSLGFSAMFQPLDGVHHKGVFPTNDRGDMLTLMSLTFCNPKDKHFCKRTARLELQKKTPQEVRVRDIPKLLAKAETKCYGFEVFYPKNHVARFNYVLNRFV